MNYNQMLIATAACLLIAIVDWHGVASDDDYSFCPKLCGRGFDHCVDGGGLFSCNRSQGLSTCNTPTGPNCDLGFVCALKTCARPRCVPTSVCVRYNTNCPSTGRCPDNTEKCSRPLVLDCNNCWRCPGNKDCTGVRCDKGYACSAVRDPNCLQCNNATQCPIKPVCNKIPTAKPSTVPIEVARLFYVIKGRRD